MAFTSTQKKRARRLSTALLKELCIPAKLKGSRLLSEAIAIAAEFPDKACSYGKLLEEASRKIDRSYSYRPASMCISTCIDQCFSRCPEERINEVFGNCIDPQKGKLTPKEFIASAGLVIFDRTIKMREW